jgi:hypothetical protein
MLTFASRDTGSIVPCNNRQLANECYQVENKMQVQSVASPGLIRAATQRTKRALLATKWTTFSTSRSGTSIRQMYPLVVMYTSSFVVRVALYHGVRVLCVTAISFQEVSRCQKNIFFQDIHQPSTQEKEHPAHFTHASLHKGPLISCFLSLFLTYCATL